MLENRNVLPQFWGTEGTAPNVRTLLLVSTGRAPEGFVSEPSIFEFGGGNNSTLECQSTAAVSKRKTFRPPKGIAVLRLFSFPVDFEHHRMSFHPIVVGALYPGITRGLSADLLVSQALGGQGLPVCTAHVVAGRGVVTDVLNVPTDTVSAQLEHLANTESPTAAKVGIVGDAPTVETTFDHLELLDGPVLLDLTLSGPSGEDVLGQRGLEALVDHLHAPDLVTLRKTDASLVAGMEIPSLDDAQVAVQRIAQQGADRVLLRCGQLSTHHFDTKSEPPEYAVDLYYDGDDIALFEAPFLDHLGSLHGASSGLTLSLLQMLQEQTSLSEALQKAKGQVTEALRAAQDVDEPSQPQAFFDAFHPHYELPTPKTDEDEAANS